MSFVCLFFHPLNDVTICRDFFIILSQVNISYIFCLFLVIETQTLEHVTIYVCVNTAETTHYIFVLFNI